MQLVYKSCACLALVLTTIVLSACSPETNTSSNFPTRTPFTRTPLELRTINTELLSVDVQIDNTGPIYKGERDASGNWNVELEISLDTEHSFVAMWFATVDTQRIPVLEQYGNFYADSATNRGDGTLTQSISSGAARFDLDCDDVTNLDELAEFDTDPLGLPGCGTNSTTDTTDDSATDDPVTDVPPIVRISQEIPDVMQLTRGCFNMGSSLDYPEGSGEPNIFHAPDERQHQVCVEPFSIGIYEVTITQWSKFDNSRRVSDNPIRNITRKEVDDYTTWLSNETGDTYRLPTEAEWEYAARGDTKTRFWTGETLPDDQENYRSSGWDHDGLVITTAERLTYPEGLLEVGTLQPNPFGLYDMLGNAMEHTCSAYSETYDEVLALETYCSATEDGRHVYRGGENSRDLKFSRSAARLGTLNYTGTNSQDGGVGFRVVKENR